MKKLLTILVLAVLITACKSGKEEQKTEKKEVAVAYESFGEKITDKDYLSAEGVLEKYKGLEVGDTLDVKFASTIDKMCVKKGCWMKLPAGMDETVMVRFKDYGFFMPLNSDGKEVIVEGKAFIKKTSVDELKHYAEDEGKSKEEIAKITEPKIELAFEASGVLMKK
jgi:hypothetical protein